jgi:hypothetical protein
VNLVLTALIALLYAQTTWFLGIYTYSGWEIP